MSGDLRFFLGLGAALFGLGAFGFLTRRNLLVMFLSAELMALGVAVNFVAFGRHHGNLQGQAAALFILAVAACESALALTLTVSLWQRKRTLDAASCSLLGEHIPEPAATAAPAGAEDGAADADDPAHPPLTPAGVAPRPAELARAAAPHPTRGAAQEASRV